MICNLEVVGSTPSIGSVFPEPQFFRYLGGYQSGQLGQTVNLLANAFVRSNRAPPTLAEARNFHTRGSYNGYYASLPSWKWEFDSPTPLKVRRCSSGVERILGKDEVMSSNPITGSRPVFLVYIPD